MTIPSKTSVQDYLTEKYEEVQEDFLPDEEFDFGSDMEKLEEEIPLDIDNAKVSNNFLGQKVEESDIYFRKFESKDNQIESKISAKRIGGSLDECMRNIITDVVKSVVKQELKGLREEISSLMLGMLREKNKSKTQRKIKIK